MGKTVTTYLIDGDPKGTRYVFASNSVCKMYVIPRSALSILGVRAELQKPSFYILLGEDESTKTSRRPRRPICRNTGKTAWMPFSKR